MNTTKTPVAKSRRRVPCPTTVEKFESVAARRRFEVLRECLEHRGFAKASSIAFAVVVHGVDDAKSRVLLASMLLTQTLATTSPLTASPALVFASASKVNTPPLLAQGRGYD